MYEVFDDCDPGDQLQVLSHQKALQYDYSAIKNSASRWRQHEPQRLTPHSEGLKRLPGHNRGISF